MITPTALRRKENTKGEGLFKFEETVICCHYNNFFYLFYFIIIRIKQDTKIAITTANLHSTQLYYYATVNACVLTTYQLLEILDHSLLLQVLDGKRMHDHCEAWNAVTRHNTSRSLGKFGHRVQSNSAQYNNIEFIQLKHLILPTNSGVPAIIETCLLLERSCAVPKSIIFNVFV